MIDDKDMIEIKLTGDMDASSRLHDSPCLTKSFSINDLKDRAILKSRIKPQPKYATIGGVKGGFGSGVKKIDSPNISCLRQMYCPDCNQRLDKDSVRFETLLSW